MIHLVVRFPTGRPTTRLSRAAVWLAVAAAMCASVVGAGSMAPTDDTGYAVLLADGWLPVVSYTAYVLFALMAISVVDLVYRFRRSAGVERLQFRWIVAALSLYMLSTALTIPLYYLGIVVPDWFFTLALVAVLASIGIAISRHRLFDIDLVVSRTLVFVGLVGFITLVYAALVVGVGSVVGGSSLGWSIAATAVVAVVFEPVRARVQRWVNRLVYGQRATPYEVLADLTGRLARTEREEGLFDRMASRVAEGTGADRVVVWTAEAGGFVAMASQPDDARPSDVTPTLSQLPGVAVPIEHDGEVLGALSVETRRGEALTAIERRLIEDLTGSAGLMMRRRRLDEELEQKAAELAESRRRLVGAQDEERRHLEQELNRGAQQQVVALRVDLDLAERTARAEGLDRVADFLGQMATETQDAIEQIRALAHGIFPPLLEAEGLTVAVTALAELAPEEVEVRNRLSDRHPLPLEAAVYFCVSEALTNAVKHGEAPMTIELFDGDGELRFEVSNSGPGFDLPTVTRGSGLDNLQDRVDALGGTIVIDSAVGRPTVIWGRLPLAVDALAAT